MPRVPVRDARKPPRAKPTGAPRTAFCADAGKYLNMHFSFRKSYPRWFSPTHERALAVPRGAFAANFAALYGSAGAADKDYTEAG